MKRAKKLISILLCAALLSPASTAAFAASDITAPSEVAPHILTTLPTAAAGVAQNTLTLSGSNKIVGETAESAKAKEDLLAQQEAEAAGKLPPQMGWSTWNFFREKINEEKAMDAAKALVSTGLNEHGYVYFNLDDCWQSSMRDENGNMQFDLTGFPSGPQFIKNVNALAGPDSEHPLRVGVYSSSGDLTCEDMPGAAGYEEKDARTFAEWGVEYLKYDYCHVVDMETDVYTHSIKAPDVDYLSVAKAGTPEGERIQAETAELSGAASTVRCGSCDGTGYVTGLNANGGAITFKKTVEEAGRYVLTVGFHKSASIVSKFISAQVNGGKVYDTEIPRTSGWSGTGRQQMYIDLEAGENTIKVFNPIDGQKADSIRRYSKMGNALKEATAQVAEETGNPEKPLFFSVCEHGRTSPWTWAGDFANSWRTTHDISDSWTSMIGIYETNVNLWSYQKPGTYNDPDMLEVGVGNLTADENQAHFSLWCMMNSPLILGCDVRNFVDPESPDGVDHTANNGAYDIITNQDVVGINQDPLLLQGKRVSTADGIDILVKPLSGGDAAVLFLNKNAAAGASASIDLSALAEMDDRITLPSASAYKVKDLWSGEETVTGTSLNSGAISKHGAHMYRVSKVEAGSVDKLGTIKIDMPNTVFSAGETASVDVVVENVGRETMKNVNVAFSAPEGFTVTGGDTIDALALNEKQTVTFEVTMPETASNTIAKPADDYILSATASYRYDGDTEDTSKLATKAIKVAVAPQNTVTKLGDHPWLSSTTGWGTIKRNKSIDGNALRLGGETYTSGIGVHAVSDITLYLGGGSYNFHSFIGVDQEMQVDTSSIEFEVLADGKSIYNSGVMKANERKEVNLNITDCRVLTLHIGDAGDGIGSDHGDWADATLTKTDDVKTYQINIADTVNGTVTTDPADTVMDGMPVTVTFTPDEGYTTHMAIVNNEVVVPVNNQYTVSNVKTDLDISAEFVKEGEAGTQKAIVSAGSVDAQEVDFGTAFASLNLPKTLALQLDGGLTATVPVVWNSEDYSPVQSGAQTITGTLTLPACIVNSNGVEVKAVVNVGEETVRNVALEATASCPSGAAASGKQASFINDNIFDDQEPGANGSGVFAFASNTAADKKYLDLTWDNPVDIDSVKLYTYFAKDQGVTNFDVLVSSDNGATFTKAASSGDINWPSPSTEREQAIKEVVFGETAKNVNVLRIMVNKANLKWNGGVITEFQAFGMNSKTDNQVTVNFSEPVNGKISAATDSGEIVAGTKVAAGTNITFTFTPNDGYRVKTATINGEAVTLTADNTYTVENVQADVTADAEFEEDVPTERSLTVNYSGKKVSLTVDSEEQRLADLLGSYKADVLSKTELLLAFAPAVEGREIAGVSVNDNAQTVTDSASFSYKFTMPNADTTLRFDFTIVNKMILRSTIETAESLQEGDEYKTAVPTVKKFFDKSLDAAVRVEADKAATQTAIDNAWKDMLKAIQMLSFQAGDKTALNALLEDCALFAEEDYTAESWAAYETALAEAQAVVDDEDALQKDIDKAYDDLMKAATSLKYLADKDSLRTLVTEAQNLDLDKYLDDGKVHFSEMLQAAEDVLANEKATQKQINEAEQNLADAMASLRLIPSREALKDLLAMVDALDYSKYTNTSVSALKASINLANGVLDNPDATSEEVAQAFELVTNAYSNLKLKPENNTSKGSSSRTPSYGNLYGAQGIAVVNAAQNVVTTASVRSDTTVDFTLKKGSAYCFKMTVTGGNNLVPSFTAGNGSILKTQFVAKIGNDYYYRVYAVGAPGQSTGVYTQLSNAQPQKHCVITIA